MDDIEVMNLEDNESFGKRCGDIFLTTKGNMAIQCTLCGVVYKNFEAYVEHLNKIHLNSSQSLENHKEEDESLQASIIKSEDESFESEFDLDEECFTDNDDSKHIPKVILKVEESLESTEEVKNVQSLNLEIPKVYRNVKKRTIFGSNITPSEERKHKCPICGFAFKDKHNMIHHFKRHSLEKNHKCPECEMKFHTRSEVKLHMKVHTGERSFLCSDCGKSFITNYDLQSHMKRHKNQRDFKCKYCDKAFFEREVLQNHERSHTLERPFCCKICQAKFSRPGALRNHLKIHENKREYKCDICGKGFNQKPGLLSHIKCAHKMK